MLKDLNITEIDLYDLTSNTTTIIYLCEGPNCYKNRLKSSKIIQRIWKNANTRKNKQGYLNKARIANELYNTSPGMLPGNYPGGLGYEYAKRDFYSFGVNEIKYLLSL